MYRHGSENTITYTSEDFVLFKESPFASWMERLTLENPDLGIVPDDGNDSPYATIGSQESGAGVQGDVELIEWEELVLLRQAPSRRTRGSQGGEIVKSLGVDGKVVVLVDREQDEFLRRTKTLDAMRGGADLIVNGQLALGPLSESADLLMRTTGYSDFGGYLYVPCDTSPRTTRHSAFRLCFLADLLHSLQGRLPMQMLVIRSDCDMVPLSTEDNIYYYRAVKQRFMTAQLSFRKHRMPDPAASSHFGRWSNCAKDVLRSRALGDSEQSEADICEEDDDHVTLQQADLARGDLLDMVVGDEVGTSGSPACRLEQRSPDNPVYTDSTKQGGQLRAACGPSAQIRERTPGDDPVDLDVPTLARQDLMMRTPPPGRGGIRASMTSLVDRDTAMPFENAVPSAPPKPRLPEVNDSVSDNTRKPTRPFSSVLITCRDSDY